MSDTEAFLSILETLENPETNHQLLYIAYDELQCIEDRMQIYALPAVLKSLHRENLPKTLKTKIRQYFNYLADGISEQVEEAVHQVINLALSNQLYASKDIIKVISKLIQDSQNLPERQLMSIPYLDLKAFFTETFVLAILADKIENYEGFIDELISELNDQDESELNDQDKNLSPIPSFLQAALESQFGRLAFRLSALIVSLTSTESLEKVRSLIGQQASVAAQAEPDLLHTYAAVRFGNQNSKAAQELCQQIISESRTLSELRNLIQESPILDLDRHVLDALFRRVGIQNTPNRTEGLPIFYWQITLWELAARIDEATTANELAKFWDPPTKLPNYLNVSCSITDITKQVKGQLESLLALQGFEGISLTVETKTRFFIKYQYQRLFLSPWIRLTINYNPYPTADEPTLLVRLMGSAFVAIRLLQKLAQDKNNWNQVEFAARFIAHASDVTATVDRRCRKGEAPQLTPPLMGLFRFAQRQIKLVGTGQFESVDPEIFVDLYDNEKSRQDKDFNIPMEEKFFLNSILPKVMTSWITDAYPSAVSHDLSGRWLRIDLISYVYSLHTIEHHLFSKRPKLNKFLERQKSLERQKAALVTRFLHPRHDLSLDDQLDWKTKQSNTKSGTTWKVHHRKLLLTNGLNPKDRLSPEEWIELQWENDNVNWGSSPSEESSNRLVYTLELLDAIGYDRNYKIEPEALEQKFDDLKYYLNSVGQAKELDRFTRLRLLEFLDSPILNERSKEQLLIASVLLEYGNIYELNKLFRRIYRTENDDIEAIDSEDIIFQETTSARQELQIALLPMISNRLDKDTREQIHYQGLINDWNQSRDPQDPRHKYHQFQDIEIFRKWVTRLLYLSSLPENTDDFSELGETLANLRRASLERQANTTIRAKTFDVEIRNDQKRLIQPSDEPVIPDWAIKAINYDPNRLTATLFYEDFDTTGITNLFEKIPQETHKLSSENNFPLDVLAVVVDVIETDQANRWKYTFDCGFKFFILYPPYLYEDKLQPGDYVKLSIYQQQEDTKKWYVKESPIKRLTHKETIGDIKEVIFDKVVKKEDNFRFWDADISRYHCEQSQPVKRPKGLARLDAQQGWIPIDGELRDLLSKIFHSQEPSKVAVLTLIKETSGQFGEKAWRFSRQPGENYLIEQHYFLGDDAETLAHKIETYENCTDGAVGLLISVTLDFEAGQVGLRLVTDAVDSDKIGRFYPNLSSPFDDRNIQWRGLFDRLEQLNERAIAENDNKGNWFFRIPDKVVIPGYPDQIKVKWADNNKRPSYKQQNADMLNPRWDEATGQSPTVIAELPPYHKISLQNGDWAAFLQRWLNLPEKKYIEAGPRITLDERALGWLDREGDGFVPCLTSEKLRVWVQAASLTMLPLEHRDKPNIGENREAEIFWIEWRYYENNTPKVNNVTIPPNAINNNKCIGILTNVADPKQGTQCQVVWEVREGKPEEQGLQIDNLDELRIDSGYKIIGERCHGEWIFHIKEPHIRARALWSLKPWKSGKSNELYYLGTVDSRDGKHLEVAESQSKPGELVCLPHRPKEHDHLAIGKENESKELRFKENTFWKDNRTSNTARPRSYCDELSSEYRRVILNFNEQLLVGHCQAGRSDSSVTVRRIGLLGEQREDNKYVLRRRFDLRPIRDSKREIKQQDTSSDSNVWRQKLKDYFRQPPKPLKATFAKHKNKYGFWLAKDDQDEIRVPEEGSNGRKWTLWVPLAPDQGTFIIEGKYSDQARICLRQEPEKISASCRSVPPMTLEEFRVHHCEAPALDSKVFLKDKDIHLYYVGPVDSEDLHNLNEETEIVHRFEMGYGETLQVPESQLEFNDSPFSKSKFSLFYGDLVKVISFKEKQINEAEEQKNQYIINIKGLQWSEARQLYSQRTKYQIVHLLHLNISKDKKDKPKLDISYIDGFNENAIAEKRKFETKKFRAYLTPESRKRLLENRYQEWLDNEKQDPVIFGRLDEEGFRNSNGRAIYFEHVQLSFIESSNGACLLEGDLVFLMADKIIKSGKNDMALTLKPPRGFDPKDVGKDAEKLRVLRRSFSVRENILKQVDETKGEDYFKDDMLLIKLFKRDKKSMTSLLLLEDNKLPTRKASALKGAVSNLGSAGLLATIVKAEDQGLVQIEYKPGVFIQLKHDEIQERPDKLLRGTVVRIELSQGSLRITRAAFGDTEYVSKDIRPVVVLPTNNVQRIEPKNWLSNSSFTIGGLPNIIARPGSYDKNQSRNSLSEEINDLMATNHPKIMGLAKNPDDKYRIAPLSNTFPYGWLVRTENSLTVQYKLLSSEPETSANSNLSWHLLSFADESVQKIIERADTEKWRYHDNETFTWVPEIQDFNFEELPDRNHSVWTGPIFFESYHQQLKLRYTQSKFRTFGFPVEELIYALNQRGGSSSYPVAGISKSSEPSLWIELAPGRLVELPVQLIVWRSGVNDKLKSLADLMYWQGFAPGDRVELELVSTDPLSIDRVALKNWIPGPRNGFGLARHHAIEPLRCFLPVLEPPDEKQGEITLGCGEFKLKLPFAEQNTNWRMVCLTLQNNGMEGIPATSEPADDQLKRNDIVLLGIDAQDNVTVLGFETMTPLLDRKKAKSWKNHPITGGLVRQQQEKFLLESDQIKNWIRIAGGALPVTVEGCHKSQNQHLLYFSMRYQQDAGLIDPGCISLARFVGLLPDRYMAMLRCGGGLIPLPMKQIFPGLDKSLYLTAVEQLKQAQVSIWLRREENSKFKVGFNDESRNQDIFVKSLDMVLQKDGEEDPGLICQSVETSNLYWFPIKQAAWTTLSVEEFRRVFDKKGLFKVRKIETHLPRRVYVSVLAVPDVSAESKKLSVGKALQVKVLEKKVLENTETVNKGEQRYLVESLTTQAILDCEIYDDQSLQPGDVLSVEVVRHIKGDPKLITVVPVGKKRKFLDLPTWMTKQLRDPGLKRLSLSNYTKWRQSEQLMSSKDDYSNHLNRLLCHYYNDAYGAYGKEARNSEPAEKQLKTAKQWKKDNGSKPEINAAFAIMAILLLDNHEETKREAYTLAQNLGRRALRSLHIEVLYQRWLSDKENRQRDDALWQRLKQLETGKHLHSPLKENSSYLIKQFCNAVEMRYDQQLIPIAQSLSAALGELSDTVELQKNAFITNQLIDLGRTLYSSGFSSSKLQDFHREKLQDILNSIDSQGLDVTLLDPLSSHLKIDNSQNQENYDVLAELFPQKQAEADRISWVFQQIEDLEELSDNYISIQEHTKKIQDRFQHIHKLLDQ
ncbi:MAG: hypothetical protein F6K59_05645 [Moorea sp. SIO3F7]|nr:hypothetical protein [Moorena sp. SIO3E8]NEP98447.1 hypothetical protein [Moorena sp. SIO3F7]